MLPNSSQAFTQLPALASSALDIASVPLNYLPSILRWLFKKKNESPQETMASRASRVSRIRLTPFKLVGYLGETQTFAAVGLDFQGDIVHGVKFNWESADTNKLSIDETGRATFLQPGQAIIIARAGMASAEATVLVRPLRRPRQTDNEWKTDQDILQVAESGGTVGALNFLPSLLDKFIPSAEAQGTLGSDMGQSAAVGVVGSPRYGVIESTRLGPVLPQTNFSLGIPLVGLGGRGLSANLTLYYNSNVWGARFDYGTNTTYYTFDPIQSWPSPGFILGFGRIAYYAWQYDPTYFGTYALMLIDPDGTRHSLGRVAQGSSTTTQTTDGTHITYVGSVLGGGTLYFQNGQKMTIGFVNNRLLPTQIIETNGNYISIAYKSSAMGFSPLAIESVTDTLGRVIQFNYGGTTLSSISPPSGTGATFNYQTVTMNTNFQIGTVENVGSSFSGISSMTSANRPPTTFTYSGYGMIYNVAWASGGVSGSVAFDYPTGGEALNGGPTFSQRTESATNAATGVYSYANSFGVTTITRPNGTKMKLTPGGAGLGQLELTSSADVTFAKTVYAYTNDPSGQPQIQSTTSYD